MIFHVKGEKRLRKAFWAKQGKLARRFKGETFIEVDRTNPKRPKFLINEAWLKIVVLGGLMPVEELP